MAVEEVRIPLFVVRCETCGETLHRSEGATGGGGISMAISMVPCSLRERALYEWSQAQQLQVRDSRNEEEKQFEELLKRLRLLFGDALNDEPQVTGHWASAPGVKIGELFFGLGSERSLNLLWPCDRCGKRSVKVAVSSLASLGKAIESLERDGAECGDCYIRSTAAEPDQPAEPLVRIAEALESILLLRQIEAGI